MFLLDYNSHTALSYADHPHLMVTHDIDRQEIVENEEMPSS
jgi:hypothetical protein